MLTQRCRSVVACLAFFAAVLFAFPASAADSLRLVSTEFPPYTGKSLAHGGIATEIATEAFKRAGYSVKVEFLPWARALQVGQTGKVDGIVGIWHSKEREQWFDFREPLLPNSIGFYKRSGTSVAYQSVADLASYSVGVVRSYANPEVFNNAKKLRVEEVVDDETNLRKLGAGRIDLVLIDKGVARYLLDTSLPDLNGKIEWIGPAVAEMPLYVAFSKNAADHEKKSAAFDRGFKALQKDGTLKKLLSKYGL
ncbi:MAG: transporter substrate-binding domain-containing protein [Gammaproteobacteria bacterium]|nr:transporter substrate-binding domain-containing protein [Gammaproteobacteria bacterium]